MTQERMKIEEDKQRGRERERGKKNKKKFSRIAYRERT